MAISTTRLATRTGAACFALALIAACEPPQETVAPEGVGQQPQVRCSGADGSVACTATAVPGVGRATAWTSPGSKWAGTSHGSGKSRLAQTPALVVDRSRDPALTNDYLRIAFLQDPTLVPTQLGPPAALRAFATASTFFEPPIPLEDVASYIGIPEDPTLNLAAFRCRPPDPDLAVLATWPNILRIIQEDFGTQFSCPPSLDAPPENEVFCAVAGYIDTPEPSATLALESTFRVAAELFDPADPERADVLRRNYGIFPAFSGLGYAVRGSGTATEFTAGDVLRNSIVPEYSLENLTLPELGCRCIIVPPYPGRSEDLLDPDFIAQRGGSECRFVDRLRVVR